MKLTILGTASPEGHPIILHPEEYVENDENRLRPGLLAEDEDIVLFDANPDIRQQLLHLKLKKLTAVFITHPHFDHIWGIGDLAQLIWLGKVPFKVYMNKDTKLYLEKYIPWVNLPIEVLEYGKEYTFNNFIVIPRQAEHSKKFETAVFEIKKENKIVLYAPDFKGFSNYQSPKYNVSVIDGAYYFGKYIEDDDHLGGNELIELYKKVSSKKYYLLSLSSWWYKDTTSNLQKKLPLNHFLPKDFAEIVI